MRVLKFTPDGRHIASASTKHGSKNTTENIEGQVVLRFVDNPEVARVVANCSSQSLAFNNDGSLLAVGGCGEGVEVYSIPSLLKVQHLDFTSAAAVAFSPDGRRLAAGGSALNIAVWDTGSWDIVTVLTGHKGAISTLAFAPQYPGIIRAVDRGMSPIASSGHDANIRIWDTVPFAERHAARQQVVGLEEDAERLIDARYAALQSWPAVAGAIAADQRFDPYLRHAARSAIIRRVRGTQQ